MLTPFRMCKRCQDAQARSCVRQLDPNGKPRACDRCSSAKKGCTYPVEESADEEGGAANAEGHREAINEDGIEKIMDAFGARLDVVESGLAKVLEHLESIGDTQVEILGHLADVDKDQKAIRENLEAVLQD